MSVATESILGVTRINRFMQWALLQQNWIPQDFNLWYYFKTPQIH